MNNFYYSNNYYAFFLSRDLFDSIILELNLIIFSAFLLF